MEPAPTPATSPGPEPGSGPETGSGSESPWVQQWRLLREDTLAPRPPPTSGPSDRLALVRYGLAQPFMGLRIIVRTNDLLGIALAPACGVLLFAGVIGLSRGVDEGWWRGVLAFFVTIVALAPVPSLLFGRVYAHLAARARKPLGLPPHQPYIRSVGQLIGEWIYQLIVLAIGVSVFVVVARWVFGSLGPVMAVLIQAIWALHWIVVEGYDNARTLPPGRTVPEMEEQAQSIPGEPWFHRWYGALGGPDILHLPLIPFRVMSSLTAHFAKNWRQEVELVERRPWISLGFGMGVAAMLAVPGLNLLFRPAVVVAGVHLRHHFAQDLAVASAAASSDAAQPRPIDPAASSGGTQPYPVVPPGA